jgi:hypothetical protein
MTVTILRHAHENLVTIAAVEHASSKIGFILKTLNDSVIQVIYTYLMRTASFPPFHFPHIDDLRDNLICKLRLYVQLFF